MIPPDLAVASNQRDSRPAAAAPRRVLLVDDDPITRQLSTRMLEATGLAVTAATDGRQAVNLFAEQPYDVVVLDVEMPRLDGPAAAQRIRRLEAGGGGGHALLVGLSAHRDPADRERCLAAGMDAFLSKPLDAAALAGLLAGLLAGDRPAAAPQATPQATPQDAPTPGGAPPGRRAGAVDWQAALAAVAGDHELLARVAAGAANELPARLGALHLAAERRDREAARLAAHAVNGALRVFGPPPVREHAARLEELVSSEPWPAVGERLAELAQEVERIVAALADGPPAPAT